MKNDVYIVNTNKIERFLSMIVKKYKYIYPRYIKKNYFLIFLNLYITKKHSVFEILIYYIKIYYDIS